MHNVLEKDKSKQVQPLTFDWTGIQYLTAWEIQYSNLKTQILTHINKNHDLIPLSLIEKTQSLKILELCSPTNHMRHSCMSCQTSSRTDTTNEAHKGVYRNCPTF